MRCRVQRAGQSGQPAGGHRSDIPLFINCHSWFSFTHGVMQPDALLAAAARLGVRSSAPTDIPCSAGLPDLLRDPTRYRVRPVAGRQVRTGP